MILPARMRLLVVLSSLLFASAPSSTAGQTSTITPAAPGSLKQMDHISVTDFGKGAPVIFIPGLASPRSTFSVAAAALAGTNHVYLVQVNGFGGDDPGANLKAGMLDGIVADLDQFIHIRHLKSVYVVGHSIGGLVGLMLAKSHPEDVHSLMVVDALPYVGDIFLPGAQVAQVEPQAKLMRDRTIASYGKPVDMSVAKRTAASQALHEDSRAMVADAVSKADPRVTGEALYEDMTMDLRPEVTTIQTPILLVYPYSGDMPKEKANQFYRAEYAKVPHVSFSAVGDSGHFVMLDQPEAFLRVLMQFVQTM